MYLDQLTPMDGVTAPVTHIPMAGRHYGMYGRQPRHAPATVSRHSNAQMGGGYSPYNHVAQATLALNMQADAETSMPVYGANLPLTQAPTTGAFPAGEQQPRNLSATTSAQAARRETRYHPYKLPPASKYTETSGEPELYSCRWGNCSEGPMTEKKIFEHFLAHGEKNRETGQVKECKWAGCTRTSSMTWDSFRRHVYETQSHAEIGSLTKVTCRKCGEKRARRSMPSHTRICLGKSKEEAGLTQHGRSSS